ncbi:MAG: hypothetical protein LBR76_03465 [Oscillospiraceae bacterium]|jgi:hypothetical protein|nr:hypothetical protein [Oscillospiraceae bacterium]
MKMKMQTAKAKGGSTIIQADELVIGSQSTFADAINQLKPLSKQKTSNAMHYLCDGMGFYGRDNEVKWLDKFRAENEPLLYTVVHGVGGVGKSKLLFEYEKITHDENWKVCFLSSSIIESLLSYQKYDYSKNLFLVIDYAARYSDLLGKWIEKLSDLEHPTNKMRIVFLERQGLQYDSSLESPSPWLETFYGAPRRKRILKDAEYEFLPLKQMSSDALKILIDDYSKITTSIIVTEKDKQSIMGYVFTELKLNFERQNPLMILLATDAFLNKQPLHKWNIEMLVQNYIERLKDNWLHALCENDKNLLDALINVLVMSTINGGFDLNDDIPDYFSEDTKRITSHPNARHIINGAIEITDDKIHPIEPDYIGEFMMLSKLNAIMPKIKQREFIACFYGKESFLNFMSKCIDDYAKSEVFPNIINNFIDLTRPMSENASDITVFAHLIGRYSLVCQDSKLKSCTDTLRDLYHQELRRDSSDNHMAILYSAHLAQLTYVQGYTEYISFNNKEVFTNNIEMARWAASELKTLHDKYKNVHQIILNYAYGLANLSIYSLGDSQYSKTSLCQLYLEYKAELPELSISYAISISNHILRIQDNPSEESFVPVEDDISKLSELYRERVLEASNKDGLILHVINDISDPELHKQVNKYTEMMFSKLSVRQVKVAVEFAKGLNNAIAAYVNAGNFTYSDETIKIIRGHYSSLEKLNTIYHNQLTEVTIEYAKAISNSIISYPINEAFDLLSNLKLICDNSKVRGLYDILIIRHIKALHNYLALSAKLIIMSEDTNAAFGDAASIYNENRSIADEIYVCFAGCCYYYFYLLLKNNGDQEHVDLIYNFIYCILEEAPQQCKTPISKYISYMEKLIK